MRSLPWIILLLALNLLACSPQTKQTAPEQQAPAFVTVFEAGSRPDVACYRIPVLLTAANGDLIAAADERVPSCGDLKFSENINIVIRRSTDNGANWTDMQTVVDYPNGQSASDPSLILDEDTGEIFLLYNYMDLLKENGVFYQKLISSKDNGATWSEPRDITDQIAPPAWKEDWKFITSGRGIQTADGTLLHTYVNIDRGLYLFGSEDHGESWRQMGNPVLPSDEAKVVELSDGTWIINGRENGSGLRHMHWSEDRGETWTSVADSSLIDPGCNASFIRYSTLVSGDERERLLFSNVYSTNERKHLTLRQSADQGKSWSEARTIYAGEAAYSSMSILENGYIGILFERDGYSEIVFDRIHVETLFEE